MRSASRLQRVLRVGTAALGLLLAPHALVGQAIPQLPPRADPNDWEAHYDLGVARLRTHGAHALASFEQASRLDPSRAEPLHGRFVAFWMSRPLEDFAAWLQGDRRLNADRDVRAADSLFALALQRNPFVHRGLEVILFDRVPGRFLTNIDTRAWLKYSTGDFQEAERLQSRSIERNPKEVWMRRDRALSRVMLRDLAGARADIEALVAALRQAEDTASEVSYYRSKHGLLHMLGLIRVQQNDLVGARTVFAEAMVEDAGFAYGQAALANVSRMERKAREATTEFELALELAPQDAVIRWWYAQALFDAGRYDASVAEAQKVVAAEPQWAAPHFTIARARERQGRTADARAAYAGYLQRATVTDPSARAIRTRFPDLR